MWKRVWTISAVLTMVSCTTIQQSLQQVRAGMDKGEVLQTVGNPKFTFREDGQDHWAYFYEGNNQEWRRDVIFDNGKVIRVTRPLNKEKWQKDIEGSSTMEEFEAIAREKQKRSSNFKDIGSAP